MNPGKDNCKYVSDLCMRIGKHTKLEAPLACTIARNRGQGDEDGPHSQAGSKKIYSISVREGGALGGGSLPGLDKDVTSLLTLGHLSNCEGLDSRLRLAFATLLVVTVTAGHGHGRTADVKAAQRGNTRAECKEGAELEGSVTEELTVEGGARPGVEV